jgi:hypothetical protein
MEDINCNIKNIFDKTKRRQKHDNKEHMGK